MPAPIPDEQAALLSAIIAEPDDDTPRLVYADWLQEHGDEEQAKFIRDSLTLARMSEQAEGRKVLEERLSALREARGRSWLEALGVEKAGHTWFSRGLPDALTYYGPLDSFREDADAVFARLPIRALEWHWDGCSEDDENVCAVAAMPGLARLHTLSLMSCRLFPTDGWDALMNSPHLRGLEYFGAIMCGLDDGEAEAPAACPNLVGLTELDLPNNQFSVAGMLAIVRSPHFPNLTAISFADNESWDDDHDEADEDEDEEVEKIDRPRYRELVAALNARFGNAHALTTWLR